MKIIANTITKVTLIILSLFWLFFFIFRLFFCTNHIILLVIFIITLIIQVIYLVRHSKLSIITKIVKTYKNITDNIYTKPLTYFYENIIKNMPGIGQFLLKACHFFCKFYKFIGFYAIRISCWLFFLLPNIILLVLIFLKVFLSINITAFFFVSSIIYLRICKIIFFILCDFSLVNKKSYEESLIITKQNERTYIYQFRETENVRTAEKLKSYINRHLLFKETYSFMQSTLDYKTRYITPWINSLFLSILLISNLKIICNFLAYNPSLIMLLLFIIIIIIKEYNNIKYEQELRQLNKKIT